VVGSTWAKIAGGSTTMTGNREIVQRRTFAKGFKRNFSVFLDGNGRKGLIFTFDIILRMERTQIQACTVGEEMCKVKIRPRSQSSAMKIDAVRN
jgi:hypothetical protein